VACAIAVPLADRVAGGVTRGVIQSPVRLEGADLELEPGEVVRVVSRSGQRLRASVARGVEGWIPAASVMVLGRRQ
jgi:hypothetical protein